MTRFAGRIARFRFSFVLNKRTLGFTGLCLGLVALANACGDKKETVTTEPQKSGKDNGAPTPTATATVATSAAPKALWMGFRSEKVIRKFDAKGVLLQTIDLSTLWPSGVTTGGISGITILDDKKILAFIDPGSGVAGKRFVLVDPAANSSKVWYSDATGVQAADLMSPNEILYLNSKTFLPRFFAARPDGVERFTPPSATSGGELALRDSSDPEPFIGATVSSGSSCTGGKITSITFLGEGDARVLLMMSALDSSGKGARLNVIGALTGGKNEPSCLSSYDYSSGSVITSADQPVQAVQMPNKKIYVLFKHTSKPKLVSFSFAANALSSPTLVTADEGDLYKDGTNYPSAMARYTSTSVLVANARAVVQIDLNTGKAIQQWNTYPSGITTIEPEF